MEVITEHSSNISKIVYDEKHKILEVEFRNSSRYKYEGVPEELFEQFKKAESFGKFFISNIRKNYKGIKL